MHVICKEKRNSSFYLKHIAPDAKECASGFLDPFLGMYVRSGFVLICLFLFSAGMEHRALCIQDE